MDPYLGEIRIFPFNFAPKGWAQCNGQLLPIQQNQALFALLGTTYGGDGRVTFQLPNLQGRVPVHTSVTFTLGQMAGEAAHTLTVPELPAHTHTMTASSAAASTVSPSGALLAAPRAAQYGPAASATGMAPAAVSVTGGGQAHSNLQPSLTVNFCIALQGIFPSRN